MRKSNLLKILEHSAVNSAANPFEPSSPISEVRSLAGEGFALAVKIFFVGLTIAGLSLVARGSVLPSSSSKISPKDTSLKAQTALANLAYGAPNPSLLTIPSLNLSATFEKLGLNPDRTIEVPKNDMAVGWFIYGAKPGEAGTSVIIGHLNSAKGPAIFANLSKIKVGDNIKITRGDGSEVIYQADSLSKFSQDNFPTKEVYASVIYPAIRLITCSGTYNKKTGRYSDNLVVFGSIK